VVASAVIAVLVIAPLLVRRHHPRSVLLLLHQPIIIMPHHGMEKLKQTNPILHKMTPPRGGTDLPDAKFMAVAGVVLGAGFYAWFIHDDSPINRTK